MKSPEVIDFFNIEITELKSKKVRERLKIERRKIIILLKGYKEQKLIKSDRIPKNKKMQFDLDKLVKAKKINLEAIQKINKLFRNI